MILIPLLKPWAKPLVVSIPMLCDAAKVPPSVSDALAFPLMTLKSDTTDCLKLEKHSFTDARRALKKLIPGIDTVGWTSVKLRLVPGFSNESSTVLEPLFTFIVM